MSLSLDSIRKENPWNGLARRTPYVLRADGPHVEEYNRTRRTKPETHVRLEVPPTPFIGSPANVRVLVLTKNPAWDEEILSDFEDNADYAQQMWQNLTFENTEFPFYVINPAFEETTAYKWWYPRLRELIEACDAKTDGHGRECVARGLLSVAFFPYHVNGYTGDITTLRCQKFARELARQFRDEEIPIVVTSHAAVWTKELPKLSGRYYAAASRQSGALNRTNLPAGAFDALVEALTRPEPDAAQVGAAPEAERALAETVGV